MCARARAHTRIYIYSFRLRASPLDDKIAELSEFATAVVKKRVLFTPGTFARITINGGIEWPLNASDSQTIQKCIPDRPASSDPAEPFYLCARFRKNVARSRMYRDTPDLRANTGSTTCNRLRRFHFFFFPHFPFFLFFSSYAFCPIGDL